LIKGDEVVGMVTSVTDFAHANSSAGIREFLQGAKGGDIVLEHMEKQRKVIIPKPGTSDTPAPATHSEEEAPKKHLNGVIMAKRPDSQAEAQLKESAEQQRIAAEKKLVLAKAAEYERERLLAEQQRPAKAAEDERKRLLAEQQRIAAEKATYAKVTEDKQKQQLAEQQRIATEKVAKSGYMLSEEQLPEGMVVWYATGASGKAAFEGEGHRIFTTYLLREIQKPYQGIEDVFKNVRKSVKEATNGKQTPYFQYITSMEGEFCFGGCSETLPNPIKRFALVIGNNSYQNSPLSSSINDARAIANVLSQKGFEVILQTDVNRSEMYQSVQKFLERLSVEKAVGLFYFGGYGIKIKGENYIIPIGHNIRSLDDVSVQSVSVGYIIQQMKIANSGKLNIIIINADEAVKEPLF
jgi:hypothetical protein